MSVIKFIGVAGHGGNDRGAKGVIRDGFAQMEADWTVSVRNSLIEYMGMMKNDYPKLKNLKFIKDDDSLTLQGVVNWLNNGFTAYNERLIFDIHFNAFNGKATGTECVIPDNPCDHEKAIAKAITNLTGDILSIPKRNVLKESLTPRKRLAIMRPKGINVLWEVCFIDSEVDMIRLAENYGELIANVARYLLDYINDNLVK